MSVLNKILLWTLFLIAAIACTVKYSHYLINVFAWGALFCISLVLLKHIRALRQKQVVSTHISTVKHENVVFIIGPWAKIWFSHARNDDAIKIEQGTVWFLASGTKELTQQLAKLEAGYPDVVPSVFFPLMPDGNQTPDIMQSELLLWMRNFGGLRLSAPLPCTFVLYSRMTEYRPAHDNALAVWSGKYRGTGSDNVTVADGLVRLCKNLEELAVQDTHHLQRYALAESMSLWLQESGLLSTLEQLFSTLPFRLHDVMLCDYGSGFVRHGAWSYWSEEAFGVLPGLSASLTTPPLPQPQSVYGERKVTHTETVSDNGFIHKAALALTLLISAAILLKFSQAIWHAHVLRNQMVIYATPELRTTPEKMAAAARIKEEYQKVRDCNHARHIWSFGFSHCERRKKELSMLIQPESIQTAQMPKWNISGFASSSAALTPEQEKSLQQLLPAFSHDGATRYLLTGYSDQTGTEEQNKKLSEQRAITVRNWLVTHTGIPVTRFITRGAGNSNLVTSSDHKGERAKNRRVEITLISLSNINIES